MLIVEYQHWWPLNFERIKKALLAALSPMEVNIEHIGSTAVPGLAAKPIIDIDIIFEDQNQFDAIAEQLTKVGYTHVGDQGINGREVFKRLGDPTHPLLDAIDHHLYVCHKENRELKRRLAFRDHLQQNRASRSKYEQLKLNIALQADQDKKVYAILKEDKARDFINSVLSG